jgi:hypothetical protein
MQGSRTQHPGEALLLGLRIRRLAPDPQPTYNRRVGLR